jgi:DNA-binding transcriptional LysR family regulator
MNPTMEFRVLRYFLAVAKEQNITKAAKILHVTQPTLSRQLMELEEELGTQLLIRGSKRVTLTDKGLLFRQRAEEIVAMTEKTEQEVKTPDYLAEGDIYIGCAETETMRLLAKVAKELQQNYHNLRYHLSSGNATDLQMRLEKGLLDFCVFMDPFDKKDYNIIELPRKDVWGLLMRKDSILTSHKQITSRELNGLPLLISEQEIQSRQGINAWLKKQKLNVVGTYNLIYNATLLVEEGMGYALTLKDLVNTGKDSKLCFKPLSPKIEAKTYFVWKKYQVFSQAAKIFLDKMQEIYDK